MKEPTTFYYQSDGSGRDSYVLKDNGGLRFEFNVRDSGDRIFKHSLRSHLRSPIKHYKDMSDRGDITTYMNWKSQTGRRINYQQAKVQNDVVKRLNTRSPKRDYTINYIIGTDKKIGQELKGNVSALIGLGNIKKHQQRQNYIKEGI